MRWKNTNHTHTYMKHRMHYSKETVMEARIKLTKRMLTKSIMDANKSVQALADEIDYSYNQIANGDKVTIDALYEDCLLYTSPSPRD